MCEWPDVVALDPESHRRQDLSLKHDTTAQAYNNDRNPTVLLQSFLLLSDPDTRNSPGKYKLF